MLDNCFYNHEEQILNKIRGGLESTDVKDHEKAARVLVNARLYLIADPERPPSPDFIRKFVEFAPSILKFWQLWRRLKKSLVVHPFGNKNMA